MSTEAEAPRLTTPARPAGSRKPGAKGSARRAGLLDAAESLMVREGYAAVTTRRVALEAGLKAPLVHYYFPTTDDLLLAMYRRSAARNHERTLEALNSARPLEALWRLGDDPVQTRLGTEVIALANHRQSLREDIMQTAEAFRVIQTEALSRALEGPLKDSLGPLLGEAGGGATGLIVLITGLARALVTEEAIGVSAGHAQARAVIDWLLRRLEPQTAEPVRAAEPVPTSA